MLSLSGPSLPSARGDMVVALGVEVAMAVAPAARSGAALYSVLGRAEWGQIGGVPLVGSVSQRPRVLLADGVFL